MSEEEEIVNKIKNIIEYNKEHRIVTIYDKKPFIEDYLQGLLDLYQKEKNKLSDKEKEIIKSYRMLVEETGREDWIICNPKTMWCNYFVIKDKIKEKIENLSISLNDIENSLGMTANKYDTIKELNIKIDVLEELLEEVQMELEEVIKKTKALLNLNDILFEETGTHLYLGNQEKELIQILLNHLTKQDKMIQKIHENFCKFDWKNSNGEEVHNQLKELYESIFKNEESE